jgi:hypothetical protein
MSTKKIISFGLLLLANLVVSFAEPCQQAVHSAEFARGQREIGQLSKPKLWTAQSLPSGMWSVLILWWLLWIVSMTLSRPIIGISS